jgi:DNA-damage-inducible protein D
MTISAAYSSQDAFEQMAHEGKSRFWIASEFMRLLGYDDLRLFNKAINKAMSACATLGIPYEENFKRRTREGSQDDFNLSRFACYLTAMNCDTRKPEVAATQVYFAAITESFRQYVEEAENVERVLVRADVTEREKSLSGVATGAGVSNFGFFQNAGYRGMYNMNLHELKVHKGLDPKKTLIDFMGKTELAAHLFRITQTEQKIVSDGIEGQRELERTAQNVGSKVRKAMIDINGVAPENLPLSQDIKKVQKEIKSTQKRFREMDAKPQLPSRAKGSN